ncbi:MAG: hypothetical protein II453_02535 [Alphaproteobacteria bacterium]|nr:hypothetical protein [Alphaproteobacteria bacterium]
MTNKEAIFELIKYRRKLEEDSTIDAEPFDIAIRSLEAWDNLVKEMEEEIYSYDAFPDIWYGISEAYDIIKKYLKEV